MNFHTIYQQTFGVDPQTKKFEFKSIIRTRVCHFKLTPQIDITVESFSGASRKVIGFFFLEDMAM